MKNGGGHFAPKLGGHFKLELGGQYHWNLHNTLDIVNCCLISVISITEKSFKNIFDTYLGAKIPF